MLQKYALATLAFFGWCGTAFAEDCSHTTYGTLKSAYVLRDQGVVVSDRPVFQSGVSATCGKWTFDIWNSVGIAGNRDGDEVDFTISRNGKLGVFTYEAALAYYALPIEGFDMARDDIVSAHIELSYPITVGKVTLTPFFRQIGQFGLGLLDDAFIGRFGSRMQVPLGEKLSLGGDIAEAINLETGKGVLSYSVQLNADLGDGWSGKVGWEDTAKTRGALFVGFSKQF